MEKQARTIALSAFTRNFNILETMLGTDGTPTEIITPQYTKLQACWSKLEDAHDSYLASITGEISDDEMKKLDDPQLKLNGILKRYVDYVNGATVADEEVVRKREDDQQKLLAAAKFDSEKTELETGIDVFDRFVKEITESISNVSDDSVKNNEFGKVEAEFNSLKLKLVKLAGIDRDGDMTDIADKFANTAEKTFVAFHKTITAALKASVPSASTTSSTSGGTTSGGSVKRELVDLPSFEGDETKSPFVKFPTWLKEWEIHIADYPNRHKSRMLNKKLDEEARSKFIGYEGDYDKSMARLQAFYGDPQKVVRHVLNEVREPSGMVEGDYGQLISYSVTLENNFSRLTSLSLEHEMSNTSIMSEIIAKFPRSIQEKWHRDILTKSQEERAKPFPLFIAWLINEKAIWECMLATDVRFEEGFHVERKGYGDRDSSDRMCHKCGKPGHIARFCTQKSQAAKTKKPRKATTVKKFWCALHKDDPSRRCYSNSCQDLRGMKDHQARIRLLKENGDCIHCCGDHKPEDCRQKERVCGGGKNDQGCQKNHKSHELFCADAKICLLMSMSVKDSSASSSVLLCIMQVPGPHGLVASVLFDSGSSCNFITIAFAKMCRFGGKIETLSVTTLGGKVSEFLTVTEYNCKLKGVDGTMVEFKAYGMETITSAVSMLGYDKLRRFFPQLTDSVIHQLQRKSEVDYLIGLGEASIHPVRTVRAKGGGDFWMYEGQLGKCVGGRHPQLDEGTTKSQGLFHINHHTQFHIVPQNSHELEFCPERSVLPYEASKERVRNTSLKIAENITEITTQIERTVELEPTAKVESTEEVESLVRIDNSSLAGQPITNISSSSTADVDDVRDEGVTRVVDLTNINIAPGTSSGVQGQNIDAAEFTPGETYHPTSNVVQCHLTAPMGEDAFFKAEALGTVVEPQCGGCRCSGCPPPGAMFSFSEQREYDMIKNNLSYDENEKRWKTPYPWKFDRSVLPKNDNAAVKQLHTMEKFLVNKPEIREEFCEQIQGMIDRGAAILLSDEELEQWDGDYHYLAMVGVKGKKSYRVCFDFARKQGGGPSFNDCLMKGPDRYVNNLLAVIIGFRNGRCGAVADITKFHNQVHLQYEDVMMQRFLWRDMKTDEPPKTYAVAVNNFGAKPANCIATLALRSSADKFAEVYPEESKEIKEQTYIDDELTAAEGRAEAEVKAQRWDEIKAHASMPNKGWTFSGDDASNVDIGGNAEAEKVLGLAWDPKSDTLLFRVKLKVKLRSGDTDVIEVNNVEQLLEYRDSMLTRRVLQSNILSIFDPGGLLVPILLQSKLLMRESWCGPKPLGWDDILPDEQGDKWIAFLSSLLNLGELRFPRSLWPQEEVVGLPVLVVFSDGSLLAFGTVAYIRWKLKSGGFWCRIIMAKCKIAPKCIITIPRMELAGAVLNNRVKMFLLKETNLKFSRVYQLVDSSTVLGYLHKHSGVYKVWEGIRVSEVQSTNEFEDGRLKNFAWVGSKDNPADWCTKPRPVKDLAPGGFWQCGPQFLQLEESEWPIKLTYSTDKFEGEMVIGKTLHVSVINVANSDLLGRIVHRCGSWRKMKRILAWIMRLGVRSGPLLASEIRRAKHLLLTYAQEDIQTELKQAADTGKGRFRRLAPSIDDSGLWRVGSRVRQYVPFTFDSKLPVILPTNHALTLKIMESSHNHSHVAADGTLCRFRIEGYWAVKAGLIAKKVANACVDCRKKGKKTISQPLGEIPAEQLQEPMAWGRCQMDLFGPYHCRSDVNTRSTKKTWGVVIEDVNSGAVHLDVVSDYSTNSVLLSLRRFGSLRGWPCQMQSDPGSQLVSASGKLENWWGSFGDSLQSLGTSKNFEWKLSPPDSPWRQGKAERRIGVVKDLLRISIGDTKVTPLELQTIFMEVANLCNERPIGISKPRADGTYSVLTPNHLLLGRSSNVLPDDTQLSEDLHYTSRYRLVHHVTSVFWRKWCTEVAPRLIFRQKWHEKGRNLRENDVVMICDASPIKGKYKLAVVESVHVSADNVVRSATVRYVNVNGDRVTTVRVQRCVQRLILILPVEEQDGSMEVKDFNTHLAVVSVAHL